MKTTRITRQAFTSLLVIGLLACFLVLATACSQSNTSSAESSSQESSYTFTDDLGNEVSVSKPERVVACMGSFADIWQLSGGTLVGVSEDAFDGYIEESESLSTVGDFTSPNLEEIIALSPDFVIMTGSSTGKDGAASQTDLRESLEASGIKTAYFTVTTFEDYLRMLEICCNINDREDLYQENGLAVKDKIDALIAEAGQVEGEAPSVLLMTTYSGGTRVQNSSSMTGAMLAELGAKNLADENTSLLRDFSLESVIEMNPDYILVVPMGNDDAAAMKNLEEATAANPAWATLDAVKNDTYITLEKEYFLYKPNEEWATSYQKLFDILYGA
ncbi:MAG: ABC transporter substrate-binding protein [Raoultibacter sp.]|jgi:iron complex transport system substrate-binding protein